MGGLAKHFGEDEEKWRLAGLLHDIDYEETKDNPEKHSLIGADIIEKAGFSPEIIQAVKTHNIIHSFLAKESRI